MTARPLFEMNDHGDIWQEPELFDDSAGAQACSSTETPAHTPSTITDAPGVLFP